MLAIEVLVEEILRLQNLTMYLQAQLQEARKMNAQKLIHRMCAAPLIIQYHKDDEIIHTDERPFCGDWNCPCHGGETWEQIDYQTEYLEQPFDNGLLTVAEYHRLFWNKQV